MSVVQYYSGKSFVHRLDPRVKLIALVLLTILIFAVTDIKIISLILLGAVILWLTAKLPVSILISYSRFLIPLLVVLMILQALFYPGETILIRPLIPKVVPLLGGLGRITMEGIVFGFVLSIRILTLIILMPLVTFTTSIEKFSLGLIKLGLPYTIAYTTTTALNMIPILQAELEVITDAQKLRAFQTFEKGSFRQKVKAYPALVVPLIIGSMRKAQLMGVAMDSKAFGADKTRTFLEDLKMGISDWLSMAAVVLFVALGFMASHLKLY